MSDRLVSGPVEMSSPFAGAFLLEDGEALAAAIRDQDWVAGGMAVAVGALDLVATVSDPLGSLIAAGLGWLIEHMDPLRRWFNDLTGDAGEVMGFAQTWMNSAVRLQEVAATYRSWVASDVEGMSGLSVESYRVFATDMATHLEAVGSWVSAVGAGLQVCAALVKMVHDLMRDTLAQAVGMAISMAVELIATCGFALPVVAEQVATRVAAMSARVSKTVVNLLESLRSFKHLMGSLAELVERARSLFDTFSPGAGLAVAGVGGAGMGIKPFRPSVHNPRGGNAVASVGKPRPAPALDPVPVTLHNSHLPQHHEAIEVQFNYNKNDPVEFDRQLRGQEEGINDLTFQEYLDNRERFVADGRTGDLAQEIERDRSVENKMMELVEQGMSPKDAHEHAQLWASDKVALHNPDQVAGGRPHQVESLGDVRINSAIGGQWGWRINRLDQEVMALARTMTPEQLASTRLNLRLVSS